MQLMIVPVVMPVTSALVSRGIHPAELARACSASVPSMRQSTPSVAVSIRRANNESYLDGWLCREKKVGGISLGRLVSTLTGLGCSDARKRRGHSSVRMGR